jgi:SOS-response transcriptional repressor LexA
MDRLTQAQQNLLQVIERLRQAMGMSPTVKEIADELSIQPPSLHEALRRLEEKGYIRCAPRKTRSVKLIKNIRSSPILRTPLVKTRAAPPCSRQSSETGRPFSAWRRIAMICASLNFEFFIRILLGLICRKNSTFEHHFFAGGYHWYYPRIVRQ